MAQNLRNDASLAVDAVDVHKSFGELEVLKGISMSAEKGDVLSIIGASGSGKIRFHPAGPGSTGSLRTFTAGSVSPCARRRQSRPVR